MTNMGTAASTTESSMAGPASAVAGAMTEKIDTPIAVPRPSAMTGKRPTPFLS